MPTDFAPAPVFICDRCGQGFLTAQPFAIHQYPVWKVLSAGEGEVCGGQISVRERVGNVVTREAHAPGRIPMGDYHR